MDLSVRTLAVLFPITFILLPAVPASASADVSLPQGQVEVRVVGEDGAGVPGVQVELRGPALEGPLVALTGGDGRAQLGPVAAGAGYRVRALHIGYAPSETPEFSVASGETHLVELHVSRRALGLDTLRVFTSPLQIRRDDTEFGSRLDAEAIRLLPTPYDASDLVGLTPGARPGQIWGGAALQANAYLLDGLVQTHPGTGGALIEPSLGWIERLEVRGLGAGAEHGGFQGGFVNAVTRSGSNVRTGSIRMGVESDALNATNLNPAEIGLETELRREVEAELGGALVRDELYYFAGAHVLSERRRAQAHIPDPAGRILPDPGARFLPWTEDRRELRMFGKLTWEPSFRNRLEVSGGGVTGRIENAGMSGYEAEAALGRLRDPAQFYTATWMREQGAAGRFELRAAGFRRDGRLRGTPGPDVPAARIFAHGDPPVPTFDNIPFRRDRLSRSHTLSGAWRVEPTTGSWRHVLTIGGELTSGSWTDRWIRNGGMTWRPVRSSRFDPADPGTWTFAGLIPTDWGGEVDLHARTRQGAVYVQDHVTVNRHLSLSPGVRMGWWAGDLVPGGDAARRFRALDARGVDPRIGITVDPSGANRLVFKGHWGRFHQSMLAQLFDRVEGGEVFSDRELWYLIGTPPTNPAARYTVAERDAMTAGDPRFILWESYRLNETGPVDVDYRQPHMDQWIVGVEASLGARVRAEALYVNRTNRDMVALVDRNLADNFHVWRNVQVRSIDGDVIRLDNRPLVLPEIHISYASIIRQIQAAQVSPDLPMPPGFTAADLEWLSYEPDYVLTNVPEGRRRMDQVQLAVHAGYPSWGASASLVWTRLRGNLNSVTGYEAGTDFESFTEIGAGPFVRPNEAVNFDGRLPGVSPFELKLALHGDVGLGVRAGAFLNAAKGDRFTPWFRVSALGLQYVTETGESLPPALPIEVAGQRIFLSERGSLGYGDRVTLDLRADRELPGTGGRVRATLDLFNVWNSGAITRVFEEVNQGSSFLGGFVVPDPNTFHGAVRERVPPRTLRIGLSTDF